MKPPVAHRDIVGMGGEGVVYPMLKIGRQGTVEHMAGEQVNLTAYASNWKMQRIRLGLAEAAVESARKWTFHTPSTGDLAEDEFWSARVPVDFSYRGDKKVAYGEWDAYLPGSRMHAPWRSEEHTSELQSLMRISYAVFCLKKKHMKQLSRKTNKTTTS